MPYLVVAPSGRVLGRSQSPAYAGYGFYTEPAPDPAGLGFLSEVISGVSGLFSGGSKEKKEKAPAKKEFTVADMAPWALGIGALLALVALARK